jgi:hypothetical protein
MSTSIFDSFDRRGMMVTQYLSGAKLEAPQPQMPSVPNPEPEQQMQQHHARQQPQQMMNDTFQPQALMQNSNGMPQMNAPNMGQNVGMDFFGGSNGMGNMNMGPGNGGAGFGESEMPLRAQRNPSIISFGGGRNMSFASEASYGRAMSGLSALSIDWENMDDFDINVDHSAHINNGMNPPSQMGGNDGLLDPKPIGGGGGGNRRRSSLRQPFVVGGSDNDAHVSFKV